MKKMKWNQFLLAGLQLFAEDGGNNDGDGADGGAGTEGAAGNSSGAGSDGKNGSGPEGKEGDGKEAKYTDDDLDRILNRKFAEWQKKKDKEVDEARRLASMSEEEKTKQKQADMERQLNELLSEKNRSEMMATARSILSERNIHADDALISLIVSEDAESTKKSIDAFANMFQKAVNKAVKDALKGEPPKTGTGKGGYTKEDILKVANRAERQRLIAANMDLFK
jgi:hypothetical protein